MAWNDGFLIRNFFDDFPFGFPFSEKEIAEFNTQYELPDAVGYYHDASKYMWERYSEWEPWDEMLTRLKQVITDWPLVEKSSRFDIEDKLPISHTVINYKYGVPADVRLYNLDIQSEETNPKNLTLNSLNKHEPVVTYNLNFRDHMNYWCKLKRPQNVSRVLRKIQDTEKEAASIVVFKEFHENSNDSNVRPPFITRLDHVNNCITEYRYKYD